MWYNYPIKERKSCKASSLKKRDRANKKIVDKQIKQWYNKHIKNE
jgi:hypothetical protein